MMHGDPEALDSKSAAPPVPRKLSSLVRTVLMFLFVGPALYGVGYYLVAGELGRGEFRWSEVPSVVFWPLLAEFMFWVSWMRVDTMLQFPLPTLLAAAVFWLVNRKMMRSLNAISTFGFVVSRSAVCLVICVGAFLILNPATVMQGWDALYFYNPHIQHPFDDSDWGFLENYGQLFHLTILGVAGALLGAAYGLSSRWFGKA